MGVGYVGALGVIILIGWGQATTLKETLAQGYFHAQENERLLAEVSIRLQDTLAAQEQLRMTVMASVTSQAELTAFILKAQPDLQRDYELDQRMQVLEHTLAFLQEHLLLRQPLED